MNGKRLKIMTLSMAIVSAHGIPMMQVPVWASDTAGSDPTGAAGGQGNQNSGGDDNGTTEHPTTGNDGSQTAGNENGGGQDDPVTHDPALDNNNNNNNNNNNQGSGDDSSDPTKGDDVVDGTDIINQALETTEQMDFSDYPEFLSHEYVYCDNPLNIPPGCTVDLDGKTLIVAVYNGNYGVYLYEYAGIQNGTVVAVHAEEYDQVYGVVVGGTDGLVDQNGEAVNSPNHAYFPKGENPWTSIESVVIVSASSLSSDEEDEDDSDDGENSSDSSKYAFEDPERELRAALLVQGENQNVRIKGSTLAGNQGISSRGTQTIHIENSRVYGYENGMLMSSGSGTDRAELKISGSSQLQGGTDQGTGIRVSGADVVVEGPVRVSGASGIVCDGSNLEIGKTQKGEPVITASVEYKPTASQGASIQGAAVAVVPERKGQAASGTVSITAGTFNGLITSLVPEVKNGALTDRYVPDTMDAATSDQSSKPLISITGGTFSSNCLAGVSGALDIREIDYFSDAIRNALPQATAADILKNPVQINLQELARDTGWKQTGSAWTFTKNGTNLTGLQDLYWNGSKKWYFFDSNGTMKTGWKQLEGPAGNGWYYFDGSGAMKTQWLKQNNQWYYMADTGKMQTGWVLDRGTYYYMGSSGVLVTGWKQLNGTWYFFDHSGAMKKGWLKYGTDWYYLNSDGSMAFNQTVDGYPLDASGKWVQR